MGEAQKPCSPAGTVVTGEVIIREHGELGDTWRREKSWVMLDPDPNSLWSDQKVGLYEKLGTS